jgi:glycosyltransferase involved in cell wall biosynthesis
MRSDLNILPVAIWNGHDTAPLTGDLDVRALYPDAPDTKAATRSKRIRTPELISTQVSTHRHATALNTFHEICQSADASHIHAAFGDLPALFAAETHRKLKIPYSVSIHANDYLCSQFKPSRLYANASFVTACNTHVRQACLDDLPDLNSRLHLIHHGLCLQDWTFAPAPVNDGDPLHCMFAGRFVNKKNLPGLIQLFSRIRNHYNNSTLSIFGDGPEQETLHHAVEAHDLDQVVNIRPALNRNELANEMHAHHLFLFTGRETEGDAEGIPNILMEAMLSGLAVMSTQSGSTEEIIRSDTACCIDTSDDSRLSEYIDSVIAQDESHMNRIKNARDLIKSSFDAEILIQNKVILLKNTVLGSGE